MPPPSSITVSLDAVIVAVTDDEPRLLVVDDGPRAYLPSAPLDLAADPTLELALRRGVEEQTGLDVGYVEQLYTFGDRDRGRGDPSARPLSVAYLALVQESPPLAGARWLGIYDLLPWEDQREHEPDVVSELLGPRLASWATDSDRVERIQVAFGPPWDGIRVLERYELLYEAGLVTSRTSAGSSNGPAWSRAPGSARWPRAADPPSSSATAPRCSWSVRAPDSVSRTGEAGTVREAAL